MKKRSLISGVVLVLALALPGFATTYTLTSFDYPGASLTDLHGISNFGQIVGVYFDSEGALHGFLATPATIPPTVWLLGSGLLGLLGFRRKFMP